MSDGTVDAIFFGPAEGGPISATDRIEARAGMGLVGDRYCREGCEPHRQITLIEREALDAVSRDYEIPFAPEETRRNIVTRGVALNHLVGREFTVGPVRLRGVRLCDPCGLMEKAHKGGLKALTNRGGLRAEILSDGPIAVGDAFRTR